MSQGRAFSTKFEDHKGLLHMKARKTYGILLNNGVSVEYDDIFQEATMSYLRAKEGYDPSLGFSFSAYMGRSVDTNLTRWAGKMLDEKAKLGLASLDEEDDEGHALVERVGGEEESVEDAMIRAESMAEAAGRLSPQGRKLLARLIRSCTAPTKQCDERTAFRIVYDALDDMGVNRNGRSKLLDEIYEAFGVSRDRPKKVSKNCIYDNDES